MEPRLPLEGLYLHLVRSGYPLSVRDFQDALHALRLGYGTLNRKDLHWLCDALWARTDEEKVGIERLFSEFPPPTPDVVEELGGGKRAEAGRPDVTRGPTNSDPRISEAIEKQGGKESGKPVGFEFTDVGNDGIALPRAVVGAPIVEPFVLTPRPVVSLRALVVAWRRYRRAQRAGPKIEFDIDATVTEQSRHGWLVEPVMVPARRNQARLLIAMDVSASMSPWRDMTRLLAESLEGSRLGHSSLYFFDNVPDGALYESERLFRPVDVTALSERHVGSSLLIVSDAGAARGFFDHERIERTAQFVVAGGAFWQPIAWLNPMPRARWERTSALPISRLDAVNMFELNDDGLTAAVDFLRGKALHQGHHAR